MALTDKLTAIADEIRYYAELEQALTLEEMTDGVGQAYDKGYELGEINGYSQSEEEFWSDFVNGRTDWSYAFQGWGHEYIRPTIQVKPTSTVYSFYKCANLKELKADCFDFSDATPSETSSSGGNSRTFYGCTELERIEDIGLPAGYYIRTFENCRALKTIDILRVTANTGFNNAFASCTVLEEIKVIDGVIGQNGLSFANSSKLTVDTINRIIDALADYSGTTGHSVTLGSTNLNKLSSAEIAKATQKGWDLA